MIFAATMCAECRDAPAVPPPCSGEPGVRRKSARSGTREDDLCLPIRHAGLAVAAVLHLSLAAATGHAQERAAPGTGSPPGQPPSLAAEPAVARIECGKSGSSWICGCGTTPQGKCVKKFKDKGCYWTPQNPSDAICKENIGDE